MMAMWRMWKKKRRQQKDRSGKPKDSLLSRKPTFAFKLGRRGALDQLHRELHKVSRGTQTDEILFGNYLGVLREHQDGVLCRQAVVVCEKERVQMCPKQNITGNSTSTGANSVQTRSSLGSVQSAPNCSANKTSNGEKFDTSRRWTFMETRKAPRGAPRGLINPYMFTPQRTQQVHTTDLKRLISEIDVRLKDCRNLAASSSTPSSSSSSHKNQPPNQSSNPPSKTAHQ
ncbi:unnamed protein product [Anisakis simplex]|uniref:Si:dkeyp-7a3.1 n=1 Tax=Anisakis simplex TaxID=6269 RepID=A0A0M3KBA6_ANISI|nr:unnamed protein product [Anisakis simplex]